MWTWSLKYVPFSEQCNAVQYVHSPSISQQESKFNIDSGPRDKSLDWSGQDTPGIGDLVPAWDSQGSGGRLQGSLLWRFESTDTQFHGFNCEVLFSRGHQKQVPLLWRIPPHESALKRSLLDQQCKFDEQEGKASTCLSYESVKLTPIAVELVITLTASYLLLLGTLKFLYQYFQNSAFVKVPN